jgi:glycosyltransferase involved in cell wall biosynthesis
VTTRRMALARQGRRSNLAQRDETGTIAPRWFLFDDLFATKYDESILDSAPPRAIHRPLPGWAQLAIELERRKDEYDVIVTWSERVALSLMTVQTLSPGGKPHVPLMYWFSRPTVQIPMRLFARSLHAIVTWSSVQRTYAIEHLGIASDKLYLVKHFVDEVFWSPREREADTICSAGAEMRDYPTLLEALAGTNIPCHIATDHVRYGLGRRVSAVDFSAAGTDPITVGRKNPAELRELYARSPFVVVPLRPSDTDNGITVILEAMAMGKPVICSRTRGQVDVIEDGVTGVFVPVGDSKALREAILSLWNDPERAKAMGRAARAYVERHHTLDKFCRDVQRAIDASLEGRAAAADGSIPASSSLRSA